MVMQSNNGVKQSIQQTIASTDETREFIENFQRNDRKTTLWKNQKKGKLYSAMIDHVVKRIFDGKTLQEAHKLDIVYALDNMAPVKLI
jgi:hypothetical protein